MLPLRSKRFETNVIPDVDEIVAQLLLHSKNDAVPRCAPQPAASQVAAERLLAFQSLKQRSDISSSKAACLFALDDFRKDCRTVQNRLAENLHQVSPLIAIGEDVQPVQRLNIFVDLTNAIP